MSAGHLADPLVLDVFIKVSQREAYGPDRVDTALPEDAAAMTPDELAETFAALPTPAYLDRLDEEFART
ncbi:MAG: hypothetical protein ABR527_01685 [Gemmatimonadota bacterium]